MRLTLLLLSVLGLPGAALACTCAAPPESDFLHALPGRDGMPTIYVPANARGLLFHARPMLAWEGTQKDGRIRLSAVPPPLTANRFTITEIRSGKRVNAILSPLFTDQIDALTGRQRYQLNGAAGDISAEVRRAHGLFRVAPQGGFFSGRSYRVTYTPDSGQALTVQVRLGPALVPAPGQTFALKAEGPAVRRLLPMLDQGGSCSADVGAAVQVMRVDLPPRYEAYRNTMSFFVMQKQALGFETKRYVSSSCDVAPFGGSNVGNLRELAYSTCDLMAAPRQAKALVGMLELDDKLVETAVIDIRLDQATGPACGTLRQSAFQLRDVN